MVTSFGKQACVTGQYVTKGRELLS